MIGRGPEGRTNEHGIEELGWAQFQRLCDLVLEPAGIDAGQWSGDADRFRTATSGSELNLPLISPPLPVPTLVCVLWSQVGPAVMKQRIRDRFAAASGEQPDAASVLVVSNESSYFAIQFARTAAEMLSISPDQVATLGLSPLSSIIDASSELRLAMPSLLGERALDSVIDRALGERSSFALEEAARLARVFVPTRAYARAVAAVDRHRFVVLTGPPEMGKTAAARMLGLARMRGGWEVHECLAPEQLWARLDAGRPRSGRSWRSRRPRWQRHSGRCRRSTGPC